MAGQRLINFKMLSRTILRAPMRSVSLPDGTGGGGPGPGPAGEWIDSDAINVLDSDGLDIQTVE